MLSFEKVMEDSETGYARYKVIYDEQGTPSDYQFLTVNTAFERLTGLKREKLLNQRVTQVLPKITEGHFDWIGYYGRIVTEGDRKVFEQYAAPLNKWFRVEVFSCEKDRFTTFFTDITHERELMEASKAFLNDGQKANTYEQITQWMKRITGADYAALNIFLEDGERFQTVAIAGLSTALQKATQMLGFNPQNKEWRPDPRRMALIQEKTVTTFEHLHELTNHVLSKNAIQLLEKTFNLGQTVIIKSTRGENIIGDFTLMFSKDQGLQNKNEAIIYADMVAMLIENRKGLHKLAEKETTLQEAKDDLQKISDNMLDLVSVTDMTGNYKFAGASHKILGYETEDLIGRNVMDFVHPEDLPSVQAEFAAFIQQKTKKPKVTYRYQCMDGSYLWFETIGTLILDEKGKPKEILFNTRDITKQKEMEERLKENQIRLELAMDSSEHGFWDKNLDTGEIYCSPRFYTMLGYEPGEFEMTSDVWSALIHPEDRPFVPELPSYLEKSEQSEDHFRLKCKDGGFKWIASRAKGHERDSQGIPHRAVGVHVDIDELKQKTEALKESHLMAKMGRWDYYHKQNNLQWSEEIFDIFKVDSEQFDATYRAFIERVHPDDREHVAEAFENSVTDHQPCEIEHKLLLDDGRIKWVKERWYTEHDENGQPQHSIGIVQDITEQKEFERKLQIAKEQAESANQAKSEFLTNMNHELRTPLNGIIGFTDILRNTPLNKEQHEYTEIVYTSSKHLADIISDILDLSRIEAGKFEFNSEKTDLRDLVEKTLSFVRPKAKEKGIILCASIEKDVPQTVEVDGSRLRQVLLNLVANAIKFTDEGSVHVSLSLRERQPKLVHLLFKVTDTGIGIKEEEQARIFEPFQQANMTTDKKAQGTGLGLAISKKILELMGGSMELKSADGEGSSFCFELWLPYEQAQLVDSEETDHEDMDELAVFTNKKILIAEDNPINMRYVQAAIAMFSKDTRIIKAKDGQEAYHLYREHQPDLVIMDIRMPHVDGYHATAMIRAHDRQIPIIAMTAKALEEDKEKCLAAGMNEYITKPVSLEQLKEVLVKHL